MVFAWLGLAIEPWPNVSQPTELQVWKWRVGSVEMDLLYFVLPLLL